MGSGRRGSRPARARLKPDAGQADRVGMEPSMKRACLKATMKMAGGLSLVTALIGIRMVTAEPAGVAAGLEELDRLDAELAAEASEWAGTDPAGEPAEASIVSRLDAAPDDRPIAADESGADALVSCRLDGRTQFMRASDCAMRGGVSKLVPRDPEDP